MVKKIKRHTCFLISNKPERYNEVIKNLNREKVIFFDGANAESFSKLVNTCVQSAETEIVILMSDKMRPTDENIQKTLNLIDEGYGFVGMYRFGFFGFKKELFRKIGPLDERFVGGCFEDDDFYIRLCEADIGMYLSHEVVYVKDKSSWNYKLSKEHFYKKWNMDEKTNKTYRKLEEVSHSYNFGPSISTSFLSWNHTKLFAKKIKKYERLEIGHE